jgi:alkanesulfonate monooxygenase SsuD/methylene tetrahydromethanopterin reductase-like flavin-dependent oxidoreductase (luciferase family)
MRPPARQPGGPPIWCGGRSDGALNRAGRLADGWIAYAITPEMYRAGLEKIAQAADEAGRGNAAFGTGHLLFTRLDDTYEKALDAATATLSQRYAMDFRRPAERYAALGSPSQVADRIRAFHVAGARHITLDLVGPYEERDRQIERIAREVFPLLADLR